MKKLLILLFLLGFITSCSFANETPASDTNKCSKAPEKTCVHKKKKCKSWNKKKKAETDSSAKSEAKEHTSNTTAPGAK